MSTESGIACVRQGFPWQPGAPGAGAIDAVLLGGVPAIERAADAVLPACKSAARSLRQGYRNDRSFWILADRDAVVALVSAEAMLSFTASTGAIERLKAATTARAIVAGLLCASVPFANDIRVALGRAASELDRGIAAASAILVAEHS